MSSNITNRMENYKAHSIKKTNETTWNEIQIQWNNVLVPI